MCRVKSGPSVDGPRCGSEQSSVCMDQVCGWASAWLRAIRLHRVSRCALRERTVGFERHHPNREVDCNRAKARDLRRAYVFAYLSAIGAFIVLA
jgi:hypothetical protein